MLKTYNYPKYPFRTPPELSGKGGDAYQVVVVGAGPVGLSAAIDLAQSGASVVLLDDDETVSVGSRGVCYAKRTLEILDRLKVGDACVAKGVTWNVGRTFFDEKEVYSFNLQPHSGHKRPGMINLQQYYLEEYLIERAHRLPELDLRFKSKVVAVSPQADGVQLEVKTPEGDYSLRADWLIVADGARSGIRRELGLDIEGRIFNDRFLIADVVMKADYPAERWFWFDPPFHRGQSVLLHKQADNVWRIDFQLGWQADPEEEKKPERVIPRIRAMLGDDREFELEWVSVYTFQCRRMQSFRQGRVLFVGDAAHQVSPFGARGANSGIQDTDNLCWKLQLVIKGLAPESLMDSYSAERTWAADENILNSTRSTDFITPKTKTSQMFRNAVLDLARDHDFARALVNSGRLSVPACLSESTLNTPDSDVFASYMLPGMPMDDAPIRRDGRDTWLLDQLGGRFGLLRYIGENGAAPDSLEIQALQALLGREVSVQTLFVAAPGAASLAEVAVAGKDFVVLVDEKGLFQQRYDTSDGSVYLIRPDQHICARWRFFNQDSVAGALQTAIGH